MRWYGFRSVGGQSSGSRAVPGWPFELPSTHGPFAIPALQGETRGAIRWHWVLHNSWGKELS